MVYQASAGNNKGNSIKSENVASASKEVKENEKNKKMVVDFYNEVLTNIISILSLNMLAKIISNIILLLLMDEKPSWIFKEDFVKNPNSSAEIKRVVAEGDTVALHVHSRTNSQDKGVAIVDIFRIKDGKIVEHWDVIQEIPSEAANDNTMF